MFARIRLITRAERDAMMLPEEALVPQGTDKFVFRVNDGKVTRVKVETGQRRDGKVEIVNGVNKDDVIVTAGQLKLRDGVSVRVAGAETPVPAASVAPMSAAHVHDRIRNRAGDAGQCAAPAAPQILTCTSVTRR